MLSLDEAMDARNVRITSYTPGWRHEMIVVTRDDEGECTQALHDLTALADAHDNAAVWRVGPEVKEMKNLETTEWSGFARFSVPH